MKYKEIIKKSLIDLKPREDRYSIVNRYENKLNERYKILKKLYNIIILTETTKHFCGLRGK